MFEKFKNNSLRNYGLCPIHYLRAPDLGWDAILKMTKVEPELIPNLNMYIFFGKGARGRIYYISNKTNSKYLKSYYSKQESEHIIYIDANRLYGYSLSNFLTTNGFT